MLVLFLTSLLIFNHPAINASDSTISVEPSFASSDPLEIALNLVVSSTFQGTACSETGILEFMLDHVMVSPVTNIAHVPHSVCPLLARVLNYIRLILLFGVLFV